MRDSAKVFGTQAAYDLFALLMPFSTYWPTGKWTISGIIDIYVTPALHLSDLGLAAVLFTIYVRTYRKVQFGRKTYPLIVPLLVLGCLAVLTAPFALDVALAFYTTLRWWLAIALALHLTMARFNVQRFVTVFLLGLLVQVLVGVGQVLLQRPIGLPGEMALPLTQSGAAVVAVAGQNWLRAYGFTFHPNVFGGYLVVALLLGMPLLLRKPGWLFVWWVLWGGLMLTFSRSALLAALLTLPMAAGWVFWQRPSSRRVLGIAVAGVLLLAGAGAVTFSEQIATRLEMAHVTEWFSLEERQAQLRMALGIVASRPLGGVGAGNFPLVMRMSGTELSAQPVHNVPLLMASEVGVLGGAVWIWALLVAVGQLVAWLPRQNLWVVVGLCAWLALWFVALFDYYPWGLNSGYLLSATVLGLTGHAMLDEASFGE